MIQTNGLLLALFMTMTVLFTLPHQVDGLMTPSLIRSQNIQLRYNTICGRLSAAADEDMVESLVEEEQRGDSLRRAFSSLNEVNNKDSKGGNLSVGSTVVPSSDIPLLGIWQFQTYELQSIFDQGFSSKGDSDAIVEKIPVATLTDPISRPGYTRYMTLYSPKYHEKPIKITPEEIGLLSMREEVMDSLLMALPVFGFWTAVAFSFANTYNERYGGNFMDALFRT